MHSKIGRNDLCPCGSGKKAKRCHQAPAKAWGSSGELRSTVNGLGEVASGVLGQTPYFLVAFELNGTAHTSTNCTDADELAAQLERLATRIRTKIRQPS